MYINIFFSLRTSYFMSYQWFGEQTVTRHIASNDLLPSKVITDKIQYGRLDNKQSCAILNTTLAYSELYNKIDMGLPTPFQSGEFIPYRLFIVYAYIYN